MPEPVIASRHPARLDLAPGDYFYCACGKSAKQPFCDGSHAGSTFTPLKFTVAEKTFMAVCQCKHTKNAPKCDGTHKTLPPQ